MSFCAMFVGLQGSLKLMNSIKIKSNFIKRFSCDTVTIRKIIGKWKKLIKLSWEWLLFALDGTANQQKKISHILLRRTLAKLAITNLCSLGKLLNSRR